MKVFTFLGKFIICYVDILCHSFLKCTILRESWNNFWFVMQQRRLDDRFLWVGLWIIISWCCPSSRSASDRNYRTFLKNSMIQAENSNCEWTRLEFHALMSTSAVTLFFNCLPWFNQFSNCIRQHTLYMYQYVCVCELDVCVFTALMLTFILLM